MSLVLDNLKKIKKQKGGGSVPPNMLNLAPKKSRSAMPNKALLVTLAVALIGGGIVFFMDTPGADYKVMPSVQKPVPKPAPTPVKRAVPEAPAVKAQTAEDIKAQIDAAVKDALEKAERERAELMQSTAESTALRAESVDVLPLPYDHAEKTEQKKVVLTDDSAGLAVKGEQGKKSAETSAVKQGPAPEPKPLRPVLTDAQKAEFDQKIIYNTFVSNGSRALSSGEFVKAADNYEKALEIKPSESALSNYIKAKIKSGSPYSVGDALKKYSSAASGKVVSAAALDLESAGFAGESLAVLRAHSTSVDKSGTVYYTAGQIHERLQNYKAAEKAYGNALAMHPADPYILYAYARMLDINMKLGEAVEAYSKISRLDAEPTIKKAASDRAYAIFEYQQQMEEEKKAVMPSDETSVSE